MGHFKKGPVELCYYSRPSVGGALQYRCAGFNGGKGSKHRIYIAMWFFCLTIKLPFRYTGEGYGSTPQYGLGYHDDMLWFHFGNATKGFNMPWALQHYRTSVLLADGTWEHEFSGKNREDKKLWDTDLWKDKLYTEKHPYTYVREKGQVQNATVTCTIEEREWRRAWLPFSPRFNYVRRVVAMASDTELGERVDSWKGGIIGFSQNISSKLPIVEGFTIKEAVRQAQATRKF